ncbi:MAG: valine--tRNA ligase [Planctomycetota bacterium]|nr:MAG: valine--tRNA ligase [Planctomycetota bacterium]
MSGETSTRYEPQAIQKAMQQRWQKAACFAAFPDQAKDPYVIMMPLPNVTGALHMGHAMDNVLQDMLIRWHRMQGDSALWMPGTDHAGIATQSVVEKRLLELEGKTRHDIGREALVERIWQWKHEYQKRINEQQQLMGCSCDWDRQRFTMDPVCAAAVRETFFRMFEDGLIYRGNRLVNWDCQLQTAVSDDEVEYATVQGGFWHLRYPIIAPKAGEPEEIVVATTRPETMLGDTAVAVHPEPGAQLQRLIAKARERSLEASAKDREALADEILGLEERVAELLPRLEQLADMAKDGRKIRLPLLGREIPLILDEWAKPELGSGCVKITPAHDPNDYEVWKRHPEIGAINVLEVDGCLNANAGPYEGLDRFVARKKLVADLEAQGLLAEHEAREIEVGHSDRSKTPIEPYLSKQWFVAMGDREGGVVMAKGTKKEFVSPGLAQAAIDAVEGEWRSPSGRKLRFWPDQRYAHGYVAWLAEKRDWCISRQLWWGHRIPVWRKLQSGAQLGELCQSIRWQEPGVMLRITVPSGESLLPEEALRLAQERPQDEFEVLVCLRNEEADGRLAPQLEELGLERDPDVLDTWFSSALWPHSTLGWPDPAKAQPEPGQAPFVREGEPSSLDYFYPGSCLVTGRDIITLWVARMVLTGLYNLGDLPFTNCFIHANILDGKGERMSKTKGNGIDPVDIIEQFGADAMRYVLCEMQTGLQDIRLPVQVESPFSGELLELAKLKSGSSSGVYLCPKTKKEFDVIGTRSDLPRAPKVTSDRFEVGRNFCNKLWNASRFALLNLGEELSFRALSREQLTVQDRWVLSRLARATEAVEQALRDYNPSAAIAAARVFFWDELCDWYLELIKPRMQDEEQAAVPRQVLAFALDQVLRLLHPFLPFITEGIWELLGKQVKQRGIEQALASSELVALAAWPKARSADIDEVVEADMSWAQAVIRAIRDLRAKYEIPPSRPLDAQLLASPELCARLEAFLPSIANLARLSSLAAGEKLPPLEQAAVQVLGDIELRLGGVLDPEKERARLGKQRQNLEKQIQGLRGKLSNENFVQRAPTELVEKERGRLADFEEQLASLVSLLTALG